MTRPASVFTILAQLTRRGPGPYGSPPFGEGLLTDYIRWVERNRRVPVDQWLETQPREREIGRPR